MQGERCWMTGVLLILALSAALPAHGAEVGQVQYLAGTLSATKPDGSVKILSQKSEISVGDTLSTERGSFAQIGFADGSTATLRPNTQMKVEDFRFKKEEPESDGMFMRLLKGGLRTVTGLIGKRSSLAAWKLQTSTATIGIRGSTGETYECLPGSCGDLPAGTYHHTLLGGHSMTSGNSTENSDPGQFLYACPGCVPVLLPENPGLNVTDPRFGVGQYRERADGQVRNEGCKL